MKGLRVTGFRSVSFAEAGHLENLEELRLKVSAINDTEPLWNKVKLTRVSVEGIYGGKDLEFVSHLPNVTVLESVGAIVDIDTLSRIKNLQELTLRECEFESLAPLMAVAPRLKALNIQDSSLLDDSTRAMKDAFMASLKNVERLDVRGTDFESCEDLTPLTGLTRLRVLHLSEYLVTFDRLQG